MVNSKNSRCRVQSGSAGAKFGAGTSAGTEEEIWVEGMTQPGTLEVQDSASKDSRNEARQGGANVSYSGIRLRRMVRRRCQFGGAGESGRDREAGLGLNTEV